MKLNLLSARTGLLWVRLGIRAFWRQPLVLTALFFLCMACMSLATLLPFVGIVLALALLPTATLIMMAASADAHQGRRPLPGVVLMAFRNGPERRRAMMVLGVLYAACFLLMIGLSALIDGGQFALTYIGSESLTQEIAESASFQGAMWLSVLLYLPLSLLFWHAPGLVYWHGVAPVKAMFFSIVACVRNIGAFTLYGLGWSGVFFATGIIVSLIITMLNAAGASPGIAATFMVFSAVVLAAMFFSSVVFSFRDCFQPPDESPVLGQPTPAG